MKFHPAVSRSFSFAIRVVLPLAWLDAGLVRAAASAGPDPTAVEIGVRSTVDERWHGVHKDGPAEHGRVFLIASLKQAPSGKKLLQPVDEAGLLQHLRRELTAQGFREMAATETPDVILTLLYGRGFVRNPYMANIAGDINADSTAPTPMESQLAAMVNPRLPAKRSFGTYELKLQAAQTEKLFIRVTAWKYPGDRKEKPFELWKTTMVVDDPDNHDLNLVGPKMLAAGVRFFDRPLAQEEVRIATPFKDGTVNLGPLIILETVDPAKAGETKATNDRLR